VTAGSTTDTTWGGPLVNYQVLTSEFIEYLRPLTIIGRMPGLTRVPFNVKIQRQTGAATVNWVGQGAPKPLTSLAFDSLTLDLAKIAGIIVLNDELVRLSNPSAEALVQSDLAKAIVQFMDSQFVDPTKAAVTGVSPASITNGVTAITPTGTTGAAFRADMKTLLSQFLTNNMQVTGVVVLMSQHLALAISLMTNSLGQREFPNLTMNGGEMFGLPVVTSENIPSTGGSPTDGDPIIVVSAPDILLADDGQVTIDASREASLQMDTAPDSPAVASTVLVSMFQQNQVAIRAERYINWAKRRSTAVSYISNAKYFE
jgi:HK97 family phage major capsid protein